MAAVQSFVRAGPGILVVFESLLCFSWPYVQWLFGESLMLVAGCSEDSVAEYGALCLV